MGGCWPDWVCWIKTRTIDQRDRELSDWLLNLVDQFLHMCKSFLSFFPLPFLFFFKPPAQWQLHISHIFSIWFRAYGANRGRLNKSTEVWKWLVSLVWFCCSAMLTSLCLLSFLGNTVNIDYRFPPWWDISSHACAERTANICSLCSLFK